MTRPIFPAPRKRHLWLPSGAPGRSRPRATAAAPSFSPSDISGWRLGFMGNASAAFGGSFPSNGANVTGLSALFSAGGTLTQDASFAVPTFAEDALGSGLHGLAFSRASVQCLRDAGAGTGWWDSNPSATVFMVVRWPTGGVAAGTQWIAGLCGPTATNSTHHQFASISQTTNHIFRCSGAQAASTDILLGSAPTDGANTLIVLRRRESASTGQRLHGWRQHTSTPSQNTGGLDTITTPLAAGSMEFTVGCRKWNTSTRDLGLEAFVGALFLFPGEMTGTQEEDMKAYLRGAFSIPA